MQEIIFNYLAENIGVAATLVIVVIVALIGLAFYLGRKLEKIESLPCEAHHTSIEEHRSDIKRFISDISEIKGSLGLLLQMQTSTPATRPFIPKKANKYSQKQSPRQLNANGISLFNDVNGQKFIDSNRDFLFEGIDKFAPKTAYDVEVSSLTVLRLNQNNDIFDSIKNWVYLAPARTIYDENGQNPHSEDVTLDDVLFVISLPLRDAYLLEHPELVPAKELEET